MKDYDREYKNATETVKHRDSVSLYSLPAGRQV